MHGRTGLARHARLRMHVSGAPDTCARAVYHDSQCSPQRVAYNGQLGDGSAQAAVRIGLCTDEV